MSIQSWKLKPAVDWRTVGLIRDRGSPNTYYVRSDGRCASRASVVQNSDRTQARYREGWRKDTSGGALARYHAAMAGRTAT
eukprot:1435454-Pyramimonas_sp.AAC.1